MSSQQDVKVNLLLLLTFKIDHVIISCFHTMQSPLLHFLPEKGLNIVPFFSSAVELSQASMLCLYFFSFFYGFRPQICLLSLHSKNKGGLLRQRITRPEVAQHVYFDATDVQFCTRASIEVCVVGIRVSGNWRRAD